jgi:2'-5' RNA ligase
VSLFIALCPPPDVLDALDGLARPEAAGVRWTTRHQWHVTLRFLGDVELAEGQVLLQSLAGFPGREVIVGPDTQRLGRAILMAPVTGADDLGAALTPDREFFGHLTLARSRRKHIPDELLGQPVAASWTATSVSLVRSTLASTGAVYDELATVPLEGA